MILAGLDIETTGTDPNKYHRLIQIGIAVKDGPTLKLDIRPDGPLMIEPEALAINGFTLTRIDQGVDRRYADRYIASFLKQKGFKPNSLTPVGWNVGGFDLVFVKRELPRTAEFFAYRALDLTGLAIMYELKTGKSYQGLKEEFNKKIAEMLGRDEQHDALYDAEAALLAIDLFKEVL